ncbi:hypothetical protein BC941DRAFT_419715 [Chlamydoabsidia padenii]|nr:hypothetical protein BC941DRAFT_419715 [Chlamydoabsidia padenii]
MAPHSRSPSPRRRRYSRSPSPRRRSYSRSRSPYSSRSRSYSSRSYSSLSRSPSPRRRRSPSPRRRRSPPRRGRSPPYRRRSPTPPPPVKPNRLMVTHLTRNVTKEHVEEIFSVYGPLTEVNFPRNRKLNTNTGRAFVEFETVDDAEKAICHMDGGQLDGQVLAVVVAPPRPRPRTGGNRYRSPIRRGRDSYVGGGRRYGRSRSRSPSPPPRYRGRRYSRSPISRSPSRRRSYSPSPIRR